MKLRLKSAVAGAAALALVSVGLMTGAGTANAYTGVTGTTPPWEVSPNNDATGNDVGGLTLYDAAGNVLTGGSNVSNVAAYIATRDTVGTANSPFNDLNVAGPNHNLTPDLWTTAPIQGGFDPTSVSGVPASVTAAGQHFIKLDSGGANWFAAAGSVTLDGFNAQYKNVFQIRLSTNTAGQYWRADIEYNPAAVGSGIVYDNLQPREWRVLFPAPTNAATTTLVTGSSPASPQIAGTSVAFTATVSGVASGGTVQFLADGVAFGAPVAYAGGTVTSPANNALAQGTRQITAQYIPAAYAAVSGSTSANFPFVVTAAPAAATSIALSSITGIDGTNHVAYESTIPVAGSATVLKVSDSSVVTAGTVTFFSDGALIGTDNLSPFTFSVSAGSLGVGTHLISAHFEPTNSALFLASNTTVSGTVIVNAPSFLPDVQGIVTTIAPGTIVLSTPYYCAPASTTNSRVVCDPAAGDTPLDLGTMTLNSTATGYTASAVFNDIIVTDTRSGNLPYTLSAQSSNLYKTAAGASPTDIQTINSQNVGLTSLQRQTGGLHFPTRTKAGIILSSAGISTNNTYKPGATPGSLVPADFYSPSTASAAYPFFTVNGTPYASEDQQAFDNPAASWLGNPVAGTAGLGGTTHAILHAGHGLGTTTLQGQLTINAPTNTESGTYAGTITFTVLGS